MSSRFYTNVEISGNNVLIREVVDGIPSMRKEQWAPTIYTKGRPRDYDGVEYKTLYGDNAYPVSLSSISDAKDYINRYDGVAGHEIFGQLNFSLQFMNEYAPTEWTYKHISAWSIDIETAIPVDANGKEYFPKPESADGEVTLITMIDMHTGTGFTFGTLEYHGKDTQYTRCNSESQLFKLFLQFWIQKKVDIITGWNINGFDIPYLINRINRILGDNSARGLSPWGRVSTSMKEFNGRIEYNNYITGVSILDYIDLYKKYILVKQESYSLGHIAMVELGHTKVDHSQYGSFTEFMTNNPELFVYYNIIDTLLVKQLDDKLKLIELVLTVAYEAKVNYEDVSSPVKTWDAIICNYCLAKNIVLPQQQREEQLPLDGAYVKEPIPGWYKDVGSVDATSLYPSIIMTNNISPETWIGNCGSSIDNFLAGVFPQVDSNTIVTPIGAMYRKDKRGMLPELVDHFMTMRKAAKGEMLRLEQVYEDLGEEIELIERQGEQTQ